MRGAGIFTGIYEYVWCMNQNGKVRQFIKKKRDALDDIIERKCTDEMGLLDLVLIEEMLNQTKQDKEG